MRRRRNVREAAYRVGFGDDDELFLGCGIEVETEITFFIEGLEKDFVYLFYLINNAI